MNKYSAFALAFLLTTLFANACAPLKAPTTQQSPAVPSTVKSISTTYNGYKEFLPVGKDTPLIIGANSQVERWVTLTPNQKVVININVQGVKLGLVDSKGVTAINNDGKLIANKIEGFTFIAKTGGVYGIILINDSNTNTPVILTTKAIVK